MCADGAIMPRIIHELIVMLCMSRENDVLNGTMRSHWRGSGALPHHGCGSEIYGYVCAGTEFSDSEICLPVACRRADVAVTCVMWDWMRSAMLRAWAND